MKIKINKKDKLKSATAISQMTREVSVIKINFEVSKKKRIVG